MDNLLQRYGKGASLLLKMGYVPGRGLGTKQQGILEPIVPVLRTKGQGIKVDEEPQMKSHIVDEWESSDEEQVVERKPLGFSKSGSDIPELWSLIDELKTLKLNIPKEVLELPNNDDELNPNLELRSALWEVLKSAKAGEYKVNYLKSEIDNIKKSIGDVDQELNILNEVLSLAKNDHVDPLLEYICGIDVDLLTEETKQEILDLTVSKLVDPWVVAVESCDFCDLDSFSGLIEIAESYKTSCKGLINDIPLTNPHSSRLSTGSQHLHLNLFESMILLPLYEKLNKFYWKLWNPIDANQGVGIFEELAIDRDLFSTSIIQVVFVDNVILPRLVHFLNEESGDPLKLVEWVTVFSNDYMMVKLVDSVFNSYINRMDKGFDDYTELKRWMLLIPEKEAEYSKKLFVQALIKIAEQYELDDIFAYDNVVEFITRIQTLLRDETFKSFREREIVCYAVIENELVLNLVNELINHIPIEEQVDFWKYWTGILNQYDILQFDILEDIKWGWQYVNQMQGNQNFNTKKNLNFNKKYDPDIQHVIESVHKEKREPQQCSLNEENIITMKNIMFIECEKRNISIVPHKVIDLGIATFKISCPSSSTTLLVYFKNNVIWGKRSDNEEYYPMSLEEVFQIVI